MLPLPPLPFPSHTITPPPPLTQIPPHSLPKDLPIPLKIPNPLPLCPKYCTEYKP